MPSNPLPKCALIEIECFSVKSQLQARYKDVAGRIITMALESVDYSEDRACKILEIVMQDDKNTKVESTQEIVGEACVDNETAADAPPPPAAPTKSDTRYLTQRFSLHFELSHLVTLAHNITFGCVNGSM